MVDRPLVECYIPFLMPLFTETLTVVHPKQGNRKVKVLEPTCSAKDDAQYISN